MNKIFDLFTKSVSKPSLPLPEGPFQVGHVDVMTPGSPQEDGSFFRLHYPAPAHTKVGHCQVWADPDTRHGLIDFVQKMAWNWPTWVNKTEFLLLPSLQKLLTPQAFLSTFNAAWKAIGKSLTIPTVLGAAMEPPLEQEGWPVVVFSHGMGCNRFIMSQVCYQLASQGVVVAALEHRDGSGCDSYFVLDGEGFRSSHQVKTKKFFWTKNMKEETNNSTREAMRSESLDLKNNLHLLGHSFGGSSVMLAAWQDPRVDSILALDPWMFPLAKQEFKIDKPITVVNTEKFLNDDNIAVIKRATCKEITVKWKVQESGVHLSATDVPMMFPSKLLRRGLGFMDKVDPEEVMKETNLLVRNWIQTKIC